jgi:hypothetical protein
MSLRHVIASAGVLLGLVVPAAGAAGAASGPALLASPVQSATGPIVAPQKPILLQLRLNPREIRVGSPAISGSAPGLTTITFLLGEPATVSFTVTRPKAVAGSFTVHGRPGGNAVPFMPRRRLDRGAQRPLRSKATADCGNDGRYGRPSVHFVARCSPAQSNCHEMDVRPSRFVLRHESVLRGVPLPPFL